MPSIRVMISSRCNDSFPASDGPTTLTAIRRELKQEIEAERLFGDGPVFEVWINEDSPPQEGSADSWETCLRQVRDADVLLVLYNGNAGWAKHGGDTGICHEELHTALSTVRAKVRLVELEPLAPLGSGPARERNKRFRDYATSQSLFRGEVAKDAAGVKLRAKQALQDALVEMVRQGSREIRRGRYDIGDALEWSRLDFDKRQAEMKRTVREYLLDRPGSDDEHGLVFVGLAGRPVLVVPHAVPAAMSVSAAREMVGQPFLRDHEYADQLDGPRAGPVHFIACHRSVTESQALRQLGFPDATVVTAPFGVYVADDVQKIQLVFLANCRDETATRQALRRLFDWLEQSGEESRLSERALARKRLVKAIAKEQAT